MEIPDIKQNLSILEVLQHYSLKPNKNNLLLCPFHEDKTSSLQLYPNTNTYHCFGCGKTGNVIQFIQDFEKIDKHNAIMKAQTLANPFNTPTKSPVMNQNENTDTSTPAELSRIAVLSKTFNYFTGAAKSHSPQTKAYLQSRNLDITKLEIGYNSGQFHHRQSMELVNSYAKYNLLLPEKSVSNEGKGFTPWAKHCIIFALRDKQGRVVSLYGRSIVNDNKGINSDTLSLSGSSPSARHFYLKDRSGLYPHYPKPETEKLILTEAIIDAATLIQITNEEQRITNYEVLACYGTNGLTEEHKAAIQELKQLKEIIFAFDADEAGKTATLKYAEELKQLFPEVKISKLELPEGQDINSLYCEVERSEIPIATCPALKVGKRIGNVNEASISHESSVFMHLLENRVFLFSNEENNFSNEKKKETSETPVKSEETEEPETLNFKHGTLNIEPETLNTSLSTSNPDYITYTTDTLEFALLGGISVKQLDRMRVTLRTNRKPLFSPLHSIRQSIDLYNDDQLEKYVRKAAERLEVGTTQINQPLCRMIEKLEEYRMKKREEQKQSFHKPKIELTEAEKKQALEKLHNPKLMQGLKSVLHEVGLIGEEDNGTLLFLIFLTRNFDNPLHVIVHGTSGSGKTHLLKSVLKLVPPEVVYTTTALTENVLFYPPYKEFWKHKILLLEDLDGSYAALLPLREFMSNQYISKYSTEHDPRSGEFKQKFLEAEGPIVIAGATTKERQYEDNANRAFLLYVNESHDHKARVMEHQSKQAAGLINEKRINEITGIISNMQRLLKPVKIINPYAPELRLPDYVFKPLRTNNHYLTLIKSITYLYQYQLPEKAGKEGRPYIETTLEHIAIANELSKELLLRKSDELSGALRDFFERLKSIIGNGKQQEQACFYSKDIRGKLRLNPMRVNRYLRELEMRGYIHKTGGNQKKGYEYAITIWDDYQVLKDGIDILDKILERLNKKQLQSEAKKTKSPSIT